MALEGLVFTTETEQHGMLEEGWKDHVLVAGLAWQLYAKVPGSQSHKREGRRIGSPSFLRDQVVLCILVEGLDRVTKGASIANVLPGQSGEGGAEWRDRGVDRLHEHGLMVKLKTTS
ncbi:hypothetical protein Tdes44962_MAKER02136 [Teratosphaeria destructans]|uniref:Uncharacterized protein n=1 Tax=Teratosphaeria destructans TaxID=418781 RepID=A0A9W7SVB3_9PEZI|nr:hypothetical protein Tdes44962_MAKER02136 [Teratosphaeria destructans]